MSLMGAQMVFICFYLWEKKWKCKNESKVKNLLFISNTFHVIFFFPLILFPFSSLYLYFLLEFQVFFFFFILNFIPFSLKSITKIKSIQKIYSIQSSPCVQTHFAPDSQLCSDYLTWRLWSDQHHDHTIIQFIRSHQVLECLFS